MKLNVTPWSKRLTALLLVLFMLVSMIPMTALAAEPPTDPPVAEAVTTTEPAPQAEPTEPEKAWEEQTARQDAAMAATGNYPVANDVSVDGGKYFAEPGCYYFKNGASACSKDPNNYNAYYNPNTGTLTLDGYNGGIIEVGGTRSKITVVLVGDNTITNGSLTSAWGGDITIKSSSGGTLSITHTQTISGSNPAIGIETGYGNIPTGNVTITGNAKVTINMTHSGTSGYEKAYGIFAKENITISESASVGITCKTPNNTFTGGDYCNGLRTGKGDVIIETGGEIKINVTNAGKDGAYSFGIYPMGTATLTEVGEMEVQWKKHSTNSNYPGGAVFRGGSFSDTNHAVNVDTTNCYASYRKGTPYQVTAGNGQLTGPGVEYPKGSGMFLKGDKVSITPNEKKGRSGEVIPFQKWTSDDVTFDKSATTASNSFTVPAKNVTVIAEHSPFDGKPTFTPTGDLNNQGVLTFKTVVNPYDGNEGFALVKVGNEGNYNNGINPNTSSQTKPYVYTYEASSGHSSSYVAPGEYYVAEKLDNWWYLSEKFTVNYVKPRPEISVSYWPDPTVFPDEEVGYAFAQGRILTIDNKGAADTGPLTITVEGANPDAFTVSPSSITNIAASKSAMSTVRPA